MRKPFPVADAKAQAAATAVRLGLAVTRLLPFLNATSAIAQAAAAAKAEAVGKAEVANAIKQIQVPLVSCHTCMVSKGSAPDGFYDHWYHGACAVICRIRPPSLQLLSAQTQKIKSDAKNRTIECLRSITVAL